MGKVNIILHSGLKTPCGYLFPPILVAGKNGSQARKQGTLLCTPGTGQPSRASQSQTSVIPCVTSPVPCVLKGIIKIQLQPPNLGHTGRSDVEQR